VMEPVDRPIATGGHHSGGRAEALPKPPGRENYLFEDFLQKILRKKIRP
jgi:hypothetical protein